MQGVLLFFVVCFCNNNSRHHRAPQTLEQQLCTYRDAYGALLSSTAPCSTNPQEPPTTCSPTPAPSQATPQHTTPPGHVQASPASPAALGILPQQPVILAAQTRTARVDVIPATVVDLDSDSDEDRHTPGALGLVCVARPLDDDNASQAAKTTPTPAFQTDVNPSADATPPGLQPPDKQPVTSDPSCKRPLLPGAPLSPPYKYQAVVRGRHARAQLAAVDCAECARFWGAMRSWGGGGEAHLPPCGHARGVGGGSPLHALRQEVGRHRFKHVPPATPAGFWDIGFGDSPDTQQRKGSSQGP